MTGVIDCPCRRLLWHLLKAVCLLLLLLLLLLLMPLPRHQSLITYVFVWCVLFIFICFVLRVFSSFCRGCCAVVIRLLRIIHAFCKWLKNVSRQQHTECIQKRKPPSFCVLITASSVDRFSIFSHSAVNLKPKCLLNIAVQQSTISAPGKWRDRWVAIVRLVSVGPRPILTMSSASRTNELTIYGLLPISCFVLIIATVKYIAHRS